MTSSAQLASIEEAAGVARLIGQHVGQKHTGEARWVSGAERGEDVLEVLAEQPWLLDWARPVEVVTVGLVQNRHC